MKFQKGVYFIVLTFSLAFIPISHAKASSDTLSGSNSSCLKQCYKQQIDSLKQCIDMCGNLQCMLQCQMTYKKGVEDCNNKCDTE